MNVIDLVLIIIFLLGLYSGYLKGFITGMVRILILAAGLLAAFFLYPYITTFLDKIATSLGIWKVPLSFIIGLIVARIVISFVASHLLSTIPEKAHTNPANRMLGIVPGAINGVIWSVIVASLLLLGPFSDRLSNLATDSKIAGKLADKANWVDKEISPFFDEVANKPSGKTKINPESEKAVSLPFKDDNPKVREDLEAKMLVLVNEERQKAGLKALKADPEMLVVAREHSKDMFARGYFSHETPEGLSPFDRMQKAKVRYFAAGENLALGQTLNICHRGLMNSSGHRKNILNPAYGRVGIAVLDGGLYGLMITQNFRN
jgi:uncharacterized protein YkwD